MNESSPGGRVRDHPVGERLRPAEDHLRDEGVEDPVAHAAERARLRGEAEAAGRGVDAQLDERDDADADDRRPGWPGRRAAAARYRRTRPRRGWRRARARRSPPRRAELVGDGADEDRLHVVLELGDAAVPIAVGQVVLHHAVVVVGDAGECAVGRRPPHDGVAEPRAGEDGDVVAARDEVAGDGDDGGDVALDGARAEEVRGRGLPGRAIAGPRGGSPRPAGEATTASTPRQAIRPFGAGPGEFRAIPERGFEGRQARHQGMPRSAGMLYQCPDVEPPRDHGRRRTWASATSSSRTKPESCVATASTSTAAASWPRPRRWTRRRSSTRPPTSTPVPRCSATRPAQPRRLGRSRRHRRGARRSA